MSNKRTGDRRRGNRTESGRSGAVPAPAPKRRHGTKKAAHKAGRPAAAKAAWDSGSSRQGRGDARRLVEVHNHYRRELTQVREILHQVRKGSASIDRARGRINILALATADGGFSEICRASCRSLAEHHRLEDRTVFPHLRRSERSLQPVLDRLDKEHRTIHTLLKDVDRALVHLARNPGDHTPVTRAINLLTDAVLAHFAYEERELLGPLARHGFAPGPRK
ncbi:hemerythrin domain-containing protein [Streptomyces sp. NPDC056500]|uniref:hemerythrin domain-containing protein n=1 Tax=Streptomyces sp. NPDC056500 TaxID=3345840 RepID=UPI0036BC1BC8